MKKTFFRPYKFAFAALASLAISCSEELPEEQIDPISPNIQSGYAVDEEFLVDEEMAYQIAQYLNLKDAYNIEEPVQEELPIDKFFPVPSDGPASYYVANYAKGGFAIISADKRNVPILAYSNEHNLAIGEVPGGMVNQFSEYHEYTLHLRDSLDYIPEEIQEMWYGYTDKEAYEKLRKSGKNQRYYSYTKGPYLATDWGQGCTYNGLLGSCSSGGSCKRLWTGCVATATAQIMGYHRKPSSLAWSTMPSSSVGNDGITDLDRLMRGIGINISMQYGCSGSGAWPKDAAKALRNNYGYESANFKTSFSWQEYRGELQSGFPVMISGYSGKKEDCFLFWCSTSYTGGHAWVGEGYRYRQYSSGNEYRFAYMNWGWDGSSNGWYYIYGLGDNWDGYKYKREMVTDIRP